MPRVASSNYTGSGEQFDVITEAGGVFGAVENYDVGRMSKALENHDHSTGKGLALSAAGLTNRTRNLRASAGVGAVVNDGTYAVPVVKCGDAATVFVDFVFPLPEDHVAGTHLTIRARYWMETAVAGNVVLFLSAASLRVGVAPGGVVYGNTGVLTVAVPGGADQVAELALTTTTAPTAGDWVVVRFARTGGDAADTAVGDLNVAAQLEVEYTADS